MLRTLTRAALLISVCVPLTAGGRSKAETTPQIPPIGLDEGLVLSACDDKPRGPDLPRFRTDVQCVESLLRLVHVSGKHRMRFLYYDPQGNLYAATRADWTIEPSGSTGYHKKGWVRHRLPVAGEQASLLPGEWKLAVWLDGLTLAESLFRLEAEPPTDDAELAHVRRLYLDLRYEEALRELEQLTAKTFASEAMPPRLWWLALAQTALGQNAAADRTLEQLLEFAPAFSLEPATVREVGGEVVAHRLETLRSARIPALYRKTTAPPEIELSPSTAPPQLGKRKRWYHKWWLYAGAAALAIPATALLAGDERVVTETGPLSVSLQVRGTSDEVENVPCSGALTAELDVRGGRPPYEAILTIAITGSIHDVLVEGIPGTLRTADTILLKQILTAEGVTSIQTPRIVFTCPYCNEFGRVALLRFAAIVKDSRETTSFEGAAVGSPVPAAILDLLAAAPQQVVRQEVRQPILGDPFSCPQEP